MTEDIEKGAQVVRALDSDGVKVRSAFWLRDPETMRYQFTIGLAESRGPWEDLRQVREALERQNCEFPIWDVNVVGSNDLMASSLRKAVATGPGVTAPPIHIGGNVVNNVFIDDAFVYRST